MYREAPYLGGYTRVYTREASTPTMVHREASTPTMVHREAYTAGCTYQHASLPTNSETGVKEAPSLSREKRRNLGEERLPASLGKKRNL